MSILITESYVNPQTPLWSSVSSVSNYPIIVGNPGGTTTNYFIQDSIPALLYTTPPSSYSIPFGSYNATLSFTVYIDPRDIDPGSPNPIQLVVTMSAVNGIGYFYCGYNLVYPLPLDITYPNGIPVILTLPFVSDGSDAGLVCYITNESGYNTYINVTTISESLVYTGIAIQTPTIFTSV